MISIFVLKTALLRFGVVVQDVSFDVDNECINVNYLLGGKKQTKSVPFSQIEALFTSKPEAPADYEVPYYAPPELQQP
jgi:hypothetical protein